MDGEGDGTNSERVRVRSVVTVADCDGICTIVGETSMSVVVLLGMKAAVGVSERRSPFSIRDGVGIAGDI